METMINRSYLAGGAVIGAGVLVVGGVGLVFAAPIAAAVGAKGDICSGTPCFGAGCLVMPEFYLIITSPNRMVEKTSVFYCPALWTLVKEFIIGSNWRT